MATLEELRADLLEEMNALEEAAERWLEAKAGRRDTFQIDKEVEEHERATRRLERRIRKKEKQHGT